MFPDLQPGTCAAVSLGRYAQEPLMEYCSLWTSADAVEMFGYESLYLDLHPLKVCVNKCFCVFVFMMYLNVSA